MLLYRKRQTFHTTVRCEGMFYELDKKGGYEEKTKIKEPVRKQVRDGLRELKHEIKNWTNEVKDALQFDPIMSTPLPGRFLTIKCLRITP